jgi:hypothetical protein
MEELDRRGLAAVLSADAHLEVRLALASLPRGHLDELADTVTIEDLERIIREYAVLDVSRQE